MSFSQYILDAREQYRLQIRERCLTLIRARYIYLSVLSGITIIASIVTNDNRANNIRFAASIAVYGLAINTLLWLIVKVKSRGTDYYLSFAAIQILLDIILASATVYYQGGLSGRGTVLYAISILGAGLLFSNFLAYVTSILGGLSYTITLIVYQIYHAEAYELYQIALPAIFYQSVFLLCAYLLAAFNNKSLQSERERSYTDLLSLLRHQLHQPTSVIAAVVDMLQHSDHYAKWPSENKVYLQHIKRENSKLNSMIGNALASVSANTKENNTFTSINLVSIINEIASNIAASSKRLQDLTLNLPNKEVLVMGDQIQINLALTNIIDNAFKYTDKGIPVMVDVSETKNHLSVQVKDGGGGIPPNVQKNLFKLFSKLSASAITEVEEASQLRSMGIGLYVSRMIIERHNGSFEITTSAEEGTQITIKLKKP